MLRKISIILGFSLFLTFSYAQNLERKKEDSLASAVVNLRFKGGDKVFFTFIGNNLKYPRQALENWRVGILLVSVKIRPSGALDSITFKNIVELGMGIEQEVARCLIATKGMWLKNQESSTLNMSIAFDMGEEYKSEATLHIKIYSNIEIHCPLNKDVIIAFEKAKKKGKYQKAHDLCEELLRRMPRSEKYREELFALKGQLKD